jgi:hypothetical protein
MVDGDEVGVYDGFQHSFGSKEIVLDHNEGDLPPFKIKTDECLEYLTEGVDPFELLQIPLIRDNKDLLWQMALQTSDTTVDIFDSETWSEGRNFEPVLNVVHKRVAAHCCHGQGVENHVQSAGHVRKTNVGREGPIAERHILTSYDDSIREVFCSFAQRKTTKRRRKKSRGFGGAKGSFTLPTSSMNLQVLSKRLQPQWIETNTKHYANTSAVRSPGKVAKRLDS